MIYSQLQGNRQRPSTSTALRGASVCWGWHWLCVCWYWLRLISLNTFRSRHYLQSYRKVSLTKKIEFSLNSDYEWKFSPFLKVEIFLYVFLSSVIILMHKTGVCKRNPMRGTVNCPSGKLKYPASILNSVGG